MKIKKENILKLLFIISSILFIIPSLRYFAKFGTVYKFDNWFKFMLDNSNREMQTLWYIIILALITIFYILIIKNRNKIFKNIKNILIYIALIGTIYVFTIPFMCSDVFYYLGVGRIDQEYNQNPYYSTIKEYVENNQNEKLEKDTVLMQGNLNDWADTTVVYGPIWQLVCKGIALLSFGNIDIGLLVFKIINLIIHILNCYLIYKITGKKIFTLIYGLNPFILIEGIVSVHNDMFVILFTLLSLYMLLKKKNIVLSVVFLGFATGIKYFSILLLPFIIIYHVRNQKPLKRFISCLKYGVIFIITLLIPYLLYAKDLSILSGMVTQQNKVAKSIYIPISEYFANISVEKLSQMLLAIFIIIYAFSCLILLYKNKIKFRQLMQNYNIFLLVFLFVLITQFQPWYLMWVFPVIMWQKPNTLKVMALVGIISEFANSVFLLNGEGYINGTPFVIIMIAATLGLAHAIEKQTQKRKIKCYTKNI